MFWRVEPFFWYDLKNWLFWKNESNIWTLFVNWLSWNRCHWHCDWSCDWAHNVIPLNMPMSMDPMSPPGIEPGSCWSAVSCSNHWAMYPCPEFSLDHHCVDETQNFSRPCHIQSNNHDHWLDSVHTQFSSWSTPMYTDSHRPHQEGKREEHVEYISVARVQPRTHKTTCWHADDDGNSFYFGLLARLPNGLCHVNDCRSSIVHCAEV